MVFSVYADGNVLNRFYSEEGAVAYAYNYTRRTHKTTDIAVKRWGLDVSIATFKFEEDGRVWLRGDHIVDRKIRNLFDFLTCCNSAGICESCTASCSLRPLTQEEYEEHMVYRYDRDDAYDCVD